MAARIVYTESTALFDPERLYRYLLTRAWKTGRRVLWILLNPSTADETKLDPTLRRCQGYSLAWGFDGFEICNMYGFRSTKPAGLWKVADPVGPGNDAQIVAAAQRADLVVVGWGGNAKIDRARDLAAKLEDAGIDLFCLRTTLAGHPNHPLYLKREAVPIPWHSSLLKTKTKKVRARVRERQGATP